MDIVIWNSTAWLVLKSRVLGELINSVDHPDFDMQRQLLIMKRLEIVPSKVLEQAQRRLQLEICDIEAERGDCSVAKG